MSRKSLSLLLRTSSLDLLPVRSASPLTFTVSASTSFGPGAPRVGELPPPPPGGVFEALRSKRGSSDPNMSFIFLWKLSRRSFKGSSWNQRKSTN